MVRSDLLCVVALLVVCVVVSSRAKLVPSREPLPVQSDNWLRRSQEALTRLRREASPNPSHKSKGGGGGCGYGGCGGGGGGGGCGHQGCGGQQVYRPVQVQRGSSCSTCGGGGRSKLVRVFLSEFCQQRLFQ
ncbi:hypothetical protein WDU94_010987 [Cyamophila willieti]